MTLERLYQQQKSLEQELEEGKALAYKAEGALMIVRVLIAELEAAQKDKPNATD